ncbi:PEP-CTERM sorting domain-containing protein [Pirellulaceae bacterium]|nr:PEP-CTERM sorting domain-containing protein [Pirellulaceae bacterium]
MRNTSTSVILLIVFASLCSTASADLILSINANDKTFAITGTDTGSAAATGSGAGLTQWEITGLGSVDGGDGNSYDNDLAFATTAGTPGNSSLGYDLLLATNSNALRLNFGTSNFGQQTFTGLGNFQSYAGLTTTDQAVFESSIGQAFVLSRGSGFSSMNVQAVPEPNSIALLSMLCVGVAVRGRRRRRRLKESKLKLESLSEDGVDEGG